MISTRLFLLLCCCIYVFPIFSQKRISELKVSKGKLTGILKFSNGTPVSYATVHIQALNKHGMSNDNGKYEFTDIPYGRYLVEVKTIEAEPESRYVDITKPTTELSIVLKENSSYNIDEIVVTGKNEGRQLKEKGFAVSMIDTKKATLQAVETTELLDRTAGIRIQQSGGLGSHTHFNINGLTGSSIRIFIDGIPLRNYGSSFSLSNIPPAQIERIEVYKGVVPAYLSEDALGGAINIVLKKEARNALFASYSYGSFNTHQGNLSGSYRDKKTGFTVDGSAYYNYTDNDYKVWGDRVYISRPPNWEIEHIKAKRFHDSFKSYGTNIDVGFTDVKWADRFILGLLYSDMDKDVQHGGTMEIVYGNRRTGQKTKMGNLRYEKRDFFINNLDFKSFVSYTHNTRWVVDTIPYMYDWSGNMIWNEDKKEYVKWNNGGGEQGKATLADNKEKTIAGRAGISYQMHPQHNISVNYLYNHFIRDIEDPMLPKAEQDLTETRYLTKQVIGATYENNFFDARLKTSAFLKYYIQHVKLKDPQYIDKELTTIEYDKSIKNTGFGFTASYSIFHNIMFQASFEKALRMPESNELLGNTSENINATYELKPEKSYNINAGFLLGPFNCNAHEFRGDVNFFIRDISDMIMRGVEDSKTGTYGYENLGKIISKGFDAEIGYNYRQKFFITYNMSLFNARFNLRYDENGKEYPYYKDRLRNAPYFTMNGNAEYIITDLFQKRDRISFNYNLGYVHEFDRTWESIGGANKDIIPTQLVQDLGIIYTFPKNKIAFSINVKNIFDEQVFDNFALQKPGRAFFGKVSYKIF